MYTKKKSSAALRRNTSSFPAIQLLEGSLQAHRDGHGFLVLDDPSDTALTSDVLIPANAMRSALHRDRVRVRITGQDRRGRAQGEITDILERPTRSLIGRVLNESGVWLLAPEDPRYAQDVLLPDGPGAAQPGQIAVAELTAAPVLYGQLTGCISEVLGDADDPGMEIEIAVRKYDVPHVFSEACLAASAALPEKVTARDRKGRVDLRDIALVTIDGADARDFDDAVYCTPARVGRSKGWRLLVAIADVSHYVRNADPIDVDAYERATSVYFPRRVIPMLPEKLSNGLCSLNPGEDRLCMVCDMMVAADGQVHAYQFYPAVMHSHARLVYEDVAAILSNTRGPEAARHAAVVPDLLNLHGVFRALLAAREARGAVDFDTVETRIVSDENGRVEKIVPAVRTTAHRLIEECMLAANVCAADFIEQAAHPALFRVHDQPSPDKLDILRSYLKAIGVAHTLGDTPVTADFQRIAQSTREREDAQPIHAMLLRSMMQAVYTPHNVGHFGLAYTAYTHFTSPIRRYPDLLVHRVIKAVLQGKSYQLPPLPTPGEAQTRMARAMQQRPHHAAAVAASTSRSGAARIQAWEAAGLHCSANERRADEASRDVQAWLKCQYMRNFLGEEFTGIVSAVTNFGIFVTLQGVYVEGLVHVSELGTDYFRFDEQRQELRGERAGVRYHIGSPVRVQVSRVDVDGRRIDLRLLTPDEAQNARKTRKTARSLVRGAEDDEGYETDDSPKRVGPTRQRSARKATARLLMNAPIHSEGSDDDDLGPRRSSTTAAGRKAVARTDGESTAAGRILTKTQATSGKTGGRSASRKASARGAKHSG